FGAATFDQHALARAHIGTVAPLLEVGKETRERHVERARERLKGGERGRVAAVFDLRQHARRKPGLGRKLRRGELQSLAEQPHLSADRDLELKLPGPPRARTS